MKKLFEILNKNNLTISFAESMTGGYLSYKLTKNSGASKVFKGAIIAYSNDVKINILNVNKQTIDQHTVVSRQVSEQLVLGLKKQIKANIYVGITGNAGPILQANTKKFNGYYTILFNDKLVTEEILFDSSDRIKNIKKTRKIIAKKIMKMIEDKDELQFRFNNERNPKSNKNS